MNALTHPLVEIGFHELFPRLSSSLSPPDLYLLSSQDYRLEPLHSATSEILTQTYKICRLYT
jgi:hypothetical protein